MRQQVIFEDLGIQSYQPTWDYQEQLLKEAVALKTEARTQNKEASEAATQHRFILVEHPPVFTLGKNGNGSNVLVSDEQLKVLGIEYYHINRGGDITYHGLQQVVGYPIIDLDKFSHLVLSLLSYTKSDSLKVIFLIFNSFFSCFKNPTLPSPSNLNFV
jgi:lipoyl(octanoyl) transferase